MAASGSSFIPTPLPHTDNLGEGHPCKGAQRNLIYITPRSSPGEGPRLVSDIRVSVSAEYSHGLCAVKDGFVKSMPSHP
ncbi:uncharacterized protein TNCV_4056071 [Trichonephila clavipes]|nr:uncharacterized protein TNCV_4056071 [Trichonephila clavipes]